jgi:hypothetical protein
MSHRTEFDKQLFRSLAVSSVFLVLIATMLAPARGFANNSIARYGAGGIELVKTEDIRMLEEILEISSGNVRVKYRFMNESDKDIQTTVAFPCPSYDPRELFYLPGAEASQGLAATFKVLVNGKPVSIKRVRKAVIGDRDVTDELRKAGLSEREIFLDDDDIIREIGTGPDDFEAKFDKFRKEFGDLWYVSDTVFWDMNFPAGKEVVVEHEYFPASGRSYAIVPNKDGIGNLWDQFGRGENEDCLDEKTKRAIENQARTALSKGKKELYVSYRSVEYILGTGRNWKGPIGEFTLRLLKQPKDFVSLCFPGKPAKISPTVYEFHEKDYVPQDKLVVYFYSVGPLE